MARLGLFDAALRHVALFDPDLVVSEGWFDADLIAAAVGGPQTYIYAGVINVQSSVAAAWNITWNPVELLAAAQSGIEAGNARFYAVEGFITGHADVAASVLWSPAAPALLPPAPLRYPLIAFARRRRFVYRYRGRAIYSRIRVDTSVAFVRGGIRAIRARRLRVRHRSAAIACHRGRVAAGAARTATRISFRCIADEDALLLFEE